MRLRLTDDAVPFVLLFVALAGFAFVVPAHNDTWWLLRSGQEIWETGTFLSTERFSHTASGATLHNHWWLSQLAFHAAFAAGGPLLLTLLAGASAWGAVFGSWRMIRGSFEVRLVLLAFLLLATAPEWAVRPQVISLALLVLSAHLVVRGREAWLPLVCLVWANAHAMVIFGVLLAGACALEAIIWDRRRVRKAVAVAAGAVAAPMVSPIGVDYWPRVLATVSMSRDLGLLEYRAPMEWVDLPFWLAFLALAALAVGRRTALVRWRPAERVLLIAALGLGVASLLAARNVAFFAVVAAPVLSRLVPGKERPRAPRPAGRGAWALLAAATLVAVALVAAVWLDGGRRTGWEPLPPGTVAAVRACRGPLFNHLEDGGPLMWAAPEVAVFVDSRMEAYPLDFLRRSRAADLEGDYRDLFDDYGIACALVRRDSPLASRLAADPAMRLVHDAPERQLFASGGPGGAVR